MKYIVKNLHSVPQAYDSAHNGQRISFAPGEQKKVKTKPPQDQGRWEVEVVEETSKPEDQENTSQYEDGGDN